MKIFLKTNQQDKKCFKKTFCSKEYRISFLRSKLAQSRLEVSD
jgi:hypothetical protein